MTTPMQRFVGRVAVITGAGGGVGRATALRLASEGADVVVVDIRSDAAQESAELAADCGVSTLALTADVSEESSIAAAIAQAMSRFGRIDVLHNNAATLGLARPHAMMRSRHAPRDLC